MATSDKKEEKLQGVDHLKKSADSAQPRPVTTGDVVLVEYPYCD